MKYMNWITLCNSHFLYSELYGKVVVASKVPLPNYRPDLDDKRPQREVDSFFFLIKLFEFSFILGEKIIIIYSSNM